MNDMAPANIEDIDVTIKLANRDTITPLGIVRDIEVLCGKIKYPIDFLNPLFAQLRSSPTVVGIPCDLIGVVSPTSLVLGSPQDDFCPIIFGRPFLNIVNAKIDCQKETVGVSFGDESHEFNFSRFSRNLHEKNYLVRMN